MTGDDTIFGFRFGDVSIRFLVSIGDVGGLASLSSIALERGRNGGFPKKVLVLAGLLSALSWNAGGGDMIGVIEGGENDSGIVRGDGVLLFSTKSFVCSDKYSGRCASGNFPGSLLQ